MREENTPTELMIDSTTSAKDEAISCLESALTILGWDEYSWFYIRLAVNEAITNAIGHGNGLGSTKKVTVRFWASPDKVKVEIQDEGKGFDPTSVPDCALPENIDGPRGRGLKIMYRYMTVKYNPAGNKVTMTGTRTQPPAPTPALT
jgi:serine/threonine-protein kinase RsbW